MKKQDSEKGKDMKMDKKMNDDMKKKKRMMRKNMPPVMQTVMNGG